MADEAEAVAYKEERRAIELNAVLADAHGAFYSFQNELASRPLGLAGQPPKEVQRLEELARNFEFAQAEAAHQQQIADREKGFHVHAEREAQRLERLAAKNAEAALFVDQREHTRNAARKDWAETKQGNEVTAAAKVTERATRRLDQQEQATMAARELARNQESTARVSNAVATSRITATNRTTHRVQREMVQERHKRHEDRVESVLQLKQNADQAFMKLKGSNERNNRARAAKEADHAANFNALVAQGDNPYKIFRQVRRKAGHMSPCQHPIHNMTHHVAPHRTTPRHTDATPRHTDTTPTPHHATPHQREVDAAARHQEKRMVADVKRKEQAVAERILENDEYAQVQEEIERQHRAYEKKYRDELGRHASEERNRQILITKTTDKVDLIDTTGRGVRPFEPSQVHTVTHH